MKRRSWLILTVLAGLAVWPAPAVVAGAESDWRGPRRDRGSWRRAAVNGKNEPGVRSAFQEVLAEASVATVRLSCDGKEVALGAVVEPGGYLVSKASVLSGKITCRFKDGTEKEARVVGQDARHDLALLQVEGRNLPAIRWCEGAPPPPGSLVATTTPSAQPIAIGVVSAELREVPGPAAPPRPKGWLGIEVGHGPAGVAIGSVVPNSPAAQAGLRAGDEIGKIDGTEMQSTDQIVKTVGSHPAGETIHLSIRRKDESIEISAKLAKPQMPQESQDQWGGGPFSERRSGFPVVLPHDTPLHPRDCGGPLVDTDGRVVGINIARALRVTTYALPANTVREVVHELKQKSNATTKDQ